MSLLTLKTPRICEQIQYCKLFVSTLSCPRSHRFFPHRAILFHLKQYSHTRPNSRSSSPTTPDPNRSPRRTGRHTQVLENPHPGTPTLFTREKIASEYSTHTYVSSMGYFMPIEQIFDLRFFLPRCSDPETVANRSE